MKKYRARKDYEAGSRGELDRYGKHLKQVEIAGFVRMQAYGEGAQAQTPAVHSRLRVEPMGKRRD